MADVIPLRHIFIDHSNIWGGARLASKIRAPKISDIRARVSVRTLDKLLSRGKKGITTKVVSGGVPPGMEVVWTEYQKVGYDTQRLFRDANWKERGVDHSLIGHMWRLLAMHHASPTTLVLASGDGKTNEFGTSFLEIIKEVLTHSRYETWRVELASFHWEGEKFLSPTNRRMMQMVADSSRGEFVNLYDSYATLVFHQPE